MGTGEIWAPMTTSARITRSKNKGMSQYLRDFVVRINICLADSNIKVILNDTLHLIKKNL